MRQEWLTADEGYGMPKTLSAEAIRALLTEGLEKYYCTDVLGMTRKECTEPPEGQCGINDDCSTGEKCIKDSGPKGFICEITRAFSFSLSFSLSHYYRYYLDYC